VNFSFAQKKLKLTLLFSFVLVVSCQSGKPKSTLPELSPTQPSETPVLPDIPSPQEPVAPALPAVPTEVPKIGLILGPGALRAYAHAGLLQEFFRTKIPVNAIVGIETGAMVAGLYAHKGQAFDVEWQMMKLKESDWLTSSVMGEKRPQEVTALNKFFDEVFGSATVESSRVPFACPALNLQKQSIYRMSKGPLAEVIRYCMSLPPLFNPYKQNIAAAVDLKDAVEFMRGKGINYVVYVHLLGGPTAENRAHWGLIHQALMRQAASVNQVIPISMSEFDFNDFEKRREMIKKGQLVGKAAAETLIKRLGL
jgi:predicted acylesterase/phospholipase RssA